MAISDKTRKILWGRSGNRCAVCRARLVAEKTELDLESVVGDECHIHSPSPNGPRHEPSVGADHVDALDNLMLLCRVHHKMVDDQVETYTAGVLRQIKRNHETWVEKQLEVHAEVAPLRLRRLKSEVPVALARIASARELFALASMCHASYQDHSADLTTEEAEMVGGFLQNVSDWVAVADEPLDKVRAVKSIQDGLDELAQNGFFVFAARERQRLEGGVAPASDWFALHISILRSTDPEILLVKSPAKPTGV